MELFILIHFQFETVDIIIFFFSSVHLAVQNVPNRDSPWSTIREAFEDRDATNAEKRHNLESELKRGLIKKDQPENVLGWRKAMRHSEVSTIIAGVAGPTHPFGSKALLTILPLNDAVHLEYILISKWGK